MTTWVCAVRAGMPSPRPQAWQAVQQAAGLARVVDAVDLIADAAIADGVPHQASQWLPLPDNLSVVVPRTSSRPPVAGLRFRWSIRRRRSRARVLLCRDARVAAEEAGRWGAVVLEWHVRPGPALARWPRAARADLHVAVAPGIEADLLAAGLGARVRRLPNACGLDPHRAARRLALRRSGPALALGLHRRGGLDLALATYEQHPGLPPLWIAGRDQGGSRWRGWRRRIEAADLPISLVGPAWGAQREDLLDRCGAVLALYPRDGDTEQHLCPLQVADALGSGRPLVVSDLPSTRAQVGPRPATFVPTDGPQAAQALAEALRGPFPEPSAVAPSWSDRGRALVAAVSP